MMKKTLGAGLAIGGPIVGRASAKGGPAFVQSIRSRSDPVTPGHIKENRERARQKFLDNGGISQRDTMPAKAPGDASDVIAHVVMYDAEKGLREFIGMGNSPKDNGEIRQDATDFIMNIKGTQSTIPSAETTGVTTNDQSTSSSGSEYWYDLSDSIWSYSENPLGKVEVPYKWRRVAADGSESSDMFGFRSDVRFIPGYIAWGNNYRNHHHIIYHFDIDPGFQYIEDYSPNGVSEGGTTTTVNLGYETAGWSWSYTNPDASIELNGDTTVGDLVWSIPNNDNYIGGNARNSTLTYEPGSSWMWDEYECNGVDDLLRNQVTAKFNEDGSFADDTGEFGVYVDFSYDSGIC